VGDAGVLVVVMAGDDGAPRSRCALIAVEMRADGATVEGGYECNRSMT
jgi:hypothetical protein